MPMLPLIPHYDAILLGNHGVTCYGTDLWKAYFLMETVEHSSRITLVAELLGGAKLLPREEVDKLFEARTRYGIASRNAAAPGCPIVADEVPNEGGRFYVTREELIALVDEALKARANGVA